MALMSSSPGVSASNDEELQLQNAILEANHNKMRTLISQGVQLIGVSGAVPPPIFIAVYKDDPIAIEMLVSAGADMEVQLTSIQVEGATPLVDAICRWGAYKAALKLVELGANVHAKMESCTDLLSLVVFYASRAGESVGDVPAGGMATNDVADRGINIAAKKKNALPLLKALVVKGVDLDHVPIDSNTGMSALTTAISNGDKYLVEYLLRHGANPNNKERTSLKRPIGSVLFLENQGNAEEITRLLLHYGADPRQEEEPGVLLATACLLKPSLVPLLLAAGADPGLADEYMRRHVGRSFVPEKCSKP